MGQVHARLGASLISEADSFFVSEPDPVSMSPFLDAYVLELFGSHGHSQNPP
jgi:hypothetical protein